MSENKKLFRDEVFEEINSPEMMGATIHVTRPSVYLILSTAALMAVVLIVWLFFGSVSDKVQIGAVVYPSRGTASATIPNDGVVRSVFVNAGDYVREQQTLALVSVDNAYSIVSAPYSGIVLQTKKENDAVKAFEPIVSLVTQDTTKLVRHLCAFADFTTQRKLRKGMEVQVSPINLPREKYGYVTGHIINIANYAITRDQALTDVKMENFVNGIFPEEGSAFVIEIEMDTKVSETKGENGQINAKSQNKVIEKLCWSFGEPKEADMSIGTFCSVQVVTKKRSMFDFLFEQVNATINQFRE